VALLGHRDPEPISGHNLPHVGGHTVSLRKQANVAGYGSTEVSAKVPSWYGKVWSPNTNKAIQQEGNLSVKISSSRRRAGGRGQVSKQRLRRRLAAEANAIDRRLATAPNFSGPVLGRANVVYELAERAKGVAHGGIGPVARLVDDMGPAKRSWWTWSCCGAVADG
jgi:hypothetical protein